MLVKSPNCNFRRSPQPQSVIGAEMRVEEWAYTSQTGLVFTIQIEMESEQELKVKGCKGISGPLGLTQVCRSLGSAMARKHPVG